MKRGDSKPPGRRACEVPVGSGGRIRWCASLWTGICHHGTVNEIEQKERTLMKLYIPILILLMAAISGAQEIDMRRHIQVDGTAKIAADVDRASWQIKIRGEAPTLAEASTKLDASTNSLRDRLKQAGFDDAAFRLSGIASGRFYQTIKNTRTLKGYYAERASIIEISDLSKRQALETMLLDDDQIEIVEVELRSSKHEQLRKKVLLSAVAAAKEKAMFLAKEAGADIGVLLAISEGANGNRWVTITENRIDQPIFGKNNTAEFEKLDYTATVTVKFELK
jgi:uncharacterized protein YggE